MKFYPESKNFRTSLFNANNSKNDFSNKNNNEISNCNFEKNNNLFNHFGINHCYRYHSIFYNNLNLYKIIDFQNIIYYGLRKQNKRKICSKDKKRDNICLNQKKENKSFDNINHTIYINRIKNNLRYNKNIINFNDNIKYNDNKFTYINILRNNYDLSKIDKVLQDNKTRGNIMNIRSQNKKDKSEEEDNLSALAEDLYNIIQLYKKNTQTKIKKQNNLALNLEIFEKRNDDEEDSKEIKNELASKTISKINRNKKIDFDFTKNDTNQNNYKNFAKKKKDRGTETQNDLFQLVPLINNKNYKNENNIQKDDEKNKKNPKKKKKVKFDLNNNYYFNYLENDLLKYCQFKKENDGHLQWFEEKKEEEIYSKKDFIKRKSIIKISDKNEIKINNNYILCENLTEEEIIPKLYEDLYIEDYNLNDSDFSNEGENISISSGKSFEETNYDSLGSIIIISCNHSFDNNSNSLFDFADK